MRRCETLRFKTLAPTSLGQGSRRSTRYFNYGTFSNSDNKFDHLINQKFLPHVLGPGILRFQTISPNSQSFRFICAVHIVFNLVHLSHVIDANLFGSLTEHRQHLRSWARHLWQIDCLFTQTTTGLFPSCRSTSRISLFSSYGQSGCPDVIDKTLLRFRYARAHCGAAAAHKLGYYPRCQWSIISPNVEDHRALTARPRGAPAYAAEERPRGGRKGTRHPGSSGMTLRCSSLRDGVTNSAPLPPGYPEWLQVQNGWLAVELEWDPVRGASSYEVI